MSIELEAISKKLDKMDKEYKKDRNQSLVFIVLAFCMAMLSITIANPNWVNIIMTIAYVILGLFTQRKAIKSNKKLDQQSNS